MKIQQTSIDEIIGSDIRPFSQSVAELNNTHETVREVITRCHDNASDGWKFEAEKIVYRLCLNRAEFDLDDVAEALKPIDHLPHEPRATGQLMLNVTRNEWCERSGVRNSKRKSRHYGYIGVYESLIYQFRV